MNDFKLKKLDDNSSYFDFELSFEVVDSFAQKLLLLLNTWTREFAYDTKKGIDYENILKENFSPRFLESFFLYTLKKQLSSFETFDDFVAEYDRINSSVKISFIAYSKSGEEVTIDNFEL